MTEQRIPPDAWPCACVRRWPNGDLRSIRLHYATEQKCEECGCEKPERKATPDTLHGEQPTEGGGA